MTPGETLSRPRVEGDREQQILEATLDVLVETGYHRLTLDAVAARAKASKATLYRRWRGKAALVVEALAHDKGPAIEPDTGSLREDLREAFCGMGGMADPRQTALFGSIITAITTDPEFAEAFRRDVVGPKVEVMGRIWARAADRGDLREDVDLDILTTALPGILMHRAHLLGRPPCADDVTRVVDTVILPAALRAGLLTTAKDLA
ncbi:MAG: TetR/AcrR family transcriptional regulator [Nocardioides sp.]